MPMRILLSAPDTSQAEEDALVRGFRTGWVAPLGPEVDAFEVELARRSAREHCVALSSGTAALHLGLLNLGVKPGDVVMVSSLTFAATANAVTYTGAVPAFVDSKADGCMDPDLLRVGIEDQLAKNHRVSAIIPVDLLGKIVDHERISEVAHHYGVPVLADAAESLGALRAGRPAASYGEAAVLSFNGNKIITTSGGGALLTDNADLAARARYLATQARQPVLHYEHVDIGYNYRLSNLLAALGRAQLARLDDMLERRRAHRRAYKSLFQDIDGVSVFGEPDGSEGGQTRDNFWLTSILIDPAVTGWDRDHFINGLAAKEIEARPIWKPMHLQPIFRENPNYVNGTSEDLFTRGVSLPSSSALSDEDFAYLTSVIRSVASTRVAP